MLRATGEISQQRRRPVPVKRSHRPRHPNPPAAAPRPAAKRFVQEAFRIGVPMRKALSVCVHYFYFVARILSYALF